MAAGDHGRGPTRRASVHLARRRGIILACALVALSGLVGEELVSGTTQRLKLLLELQEVSP